MASMRRFVSKHGKQPEPLSILSLSAGEEEEALQLIQATAPPSTKSQHPSYSAHRACGLFPAEPIPAFAQGLSLVHKRSRDLASSKEMMEALLLNLSSPHSTACSLLLLDTILILQIQSEEMQRCFFNLGGIGKVPDPALHRLSNPACPGFASPSHDP